MPTPVDRAPAFPARPTAARPGPGPAPAGPGSAHPDTGPRASGPGSARPGPGGAPAPDAAPPPSRRSPARRLRRVAAADLTASLVVFLVALPLCVGIAVASGVPAELGLVTGVVGGLVAGLLPGSSLQVSGPAAGMTVLVAQAVDAYGVAGLGVVVLGAGLIQLLLGALRLGRWFRAVSVAVVEGMLAGIGLVIVAGQLYALADLAAPAGGHAKLTGLVDLPARVAASPGAPVALALGAGTLAVLLLWPRVPARLRVLPAPLVAVAGATLVTALAQVPVARIDVRGPLSVLDPPGGGDLARLAEPALLGTVAAFALVASAESLFCAAAVDRMHDGPRTRLDRELVAQGAGNTVCGLLGALPMTAVIVRSAANVQAGARTRASRVLHGVWLLLFAALLPGLLGHIPLAALAAVLVHAGCRLVPVRSLRPLWREHRGEAVVLLATAAAVVALDLFQGVLLGLLLAVVKTAWDTSALRTVVVRPARGPVRVVLSGNATFLRLPRMLDTLEALPADRPVELDLTGVRHLDHACRSALETWAQRHHAGGRVPVRVRTAA